jgi:hypothetical protein
VIVSKVGLGGCIEASAGGASIVVDW